jgi:hypothetical protein
MSRELDPCLRHRSERLRRVWPLASLEEHEHASRRGRGEPQQSGAGGDQRIAHLITS